MSSAAKSILIFGAYLAVLGVGFLFAPNLLLGVFGFSPTNEVWIRVIAMLMLILAFYYIQMARQELTGFFRYTVYARAIVIGFFAAFVALGFAPPVLILFGVVDLLGALWTGVALRRSAKSA